MTTISERFRRDYAPAFLRFLAQRSEGALATAYELGRNAMLNEFSMLDLVQMHHEVVLRVLKESRSDEDLENVASAASAFLVEVLSTFEMTQRGFRGGSLPLESGPVGQAASPEAEGPA